MELRARIRHFARPAALSLAAVSALLVPAVAGPATAAAKSKRYPVVTSVRPMNPKVGDTIVIRGRNFKRGKNKNAVVFKRDGQRAVFQKSTLATAKQIRVVVPESLRPYLPDNTSARFRLRILSQRFSKKFTSISASPTITALPKPTGGGTTVNGGTIVTPNAPGTPVTPAKVCHGDEDGDLLDASLENDLGLDACNADSDGDGVPDGYEYQSARDLNDDEFQETNRYLPFPGTRPYPNPLDKDADTDYDGDGLPLGSEYKLWKRYGAAPAGLLPNDSYRLYYSDGEQYSLSTRAGGTGRRTPSQPAGTYAKAAQFLSWASKPENGYATVYLNNDIDTPWYGPRFPYDIRDTNLSGSVTPSEVSLADLDDDGFISDDERDEDADGLSNIDELRAAMQPSYWKECYKVIGEGPFPITYAGTDLTNPDTDGDTILDGADDQDHDDVPNVMELSRFRASGFSDWLTKPCTVDSTLKNGPDVDGDAKPDWVILHDRTEYGRVNPFNPCLPYPLSRTCPKGQTFGESYAPFDNSPWYALQ
jgi:hypothetical protein